MIGSFVLRATAAKCAASCSKTCERCGASGFTVRMSAYSSARCENMRPIMASSVR